jgi:hypothetical protein
MAKKKKKKGNKNPLFKTLKPLFKENRVLMTVLGAAAGGAALAAILGSDRGKQVITTLSESVKELMNLDNDKRPSRPKLVSKKPATSTTP